MTRYCPHQPPTVTLGYQHAGRYEAATLTTDFEVERPSLPFHTAFFMSAAGDQTWQHIAAAGALDVYAGWVRWPTGGVDYGCWLSGLSHDDADTLRRIVRQERLVRWTFWAVTIWAVPEDPYGIDLAWLPGLAAARPDRHTPAVNASSPILRRAS